MAPCPSRSGPEPKTPSARAWPTSKTQVQDLRSGLKGSAGGW